MWQIVYWVSELALISFMYQNRGKWCQCCIQASKSSCVQETMNANEEDNHCPGYKLPRGAAFSLWKMQIKQIFCLDQANHLHCWNSGFHALRRYDELKSLGVTHVVSVLRWPIEEELVRPYKHLQIEVDDDEDENLLESFAPCNTFIAEALNAGGGVFVHW